MTRVHPPTKSIALWNLTLSHFILLLAWLPPWSNRWRFPAWPRQPRRRGRQPCPRLPLPAVAATRGFSLASMAWGCPRVFARFRPRSGWPAAWWRSAAAPWFVRPRRRPSSVWFSYLPKFCCLEQLMFVVSLGVVVKLEWLSVVVSNFWRRNVVFWH